MTQDDEEFRDELIDCLYAIQRRLEEISKTLSAMPHNIAFMQGYKPYPKVPTKDSETNIGKFDE